jgi:hypothetical protein
MAVDTANERLSLPQRYWLLLCILVAIFSPLVVQWLNAEAHNIAYKQATEHPAVSGGSGGTSPSGGAVAPGDTSRPGSVNPMGSSAHTSTNDSVSK